MKKSVIFCFICISFFFTSCATWAGGDKKDSVSSVYNDQGYMVTKTPLDYDEKFGYEVLVYKYSEDSTLVKNEVYVSKNTWQKLPEPNDTLIVILEYLESIEYGINDIGISLLWDFTFNQCVGYEIKRK